MPSGLYGDESDASTLYDVKVPSREVGIVYNSKNTLSKRFRPSKNQAVVAIVHRENMASLSDKLDNEKSRWMGLRRPKCKYNKSTGYCRMVHADPER